MAAKIKFSEKKVSELIPYARNARTHSDEQVAQIAASIKEFGFVNPVLVDTENVLIAGHGRVMAAQRLKLETIPAITVSGLTDSQRRALILADNRLALSAGWDEEMLRLELSDLATDDYDVEIIGFTPGELADLMPDVDAAALPDLATDEDNPYQQMTFTLSTLQTETVKAAIGMAKEQGEFVDTDNENSNGNALARICEIYIMVTNEKVAKQPKRAKR